MYVAYDGAGMPMMQAAVPPTPPHFPPNLPPPVFPEALLLPQMKDQRQSSAGGGSFEDGSRFRGTGAVTAAETKEAGEESEESEETWLQKWGRLHEYQKKAQRERVAKHVSTNLWKNCMRLLSKPSTPTPPIAPPDEEGAALGDATSPREGPSSGSSSSTRADRLVYWLEDERVKEAVVAETLIMQTQEAQAPGSSAESRAPSSSYSYASSRRKVPPLLFESRFECGNLYAATQLGREGGCSYELFCRSDSASLSHRGQWFYFAVEGMQRGREYTFTVCNAEKPSSSFNDGMQPVMFSPKRAREAGVGWRRVGHNIAYHQNCYQRRKVKANAKGKAAKKKGGKDGAPAMTWISLYSANFSIIAEEGWGGDGEQVFLAYCYPYSYTQCLTHIKEIRSQPNADRIIRQQELCRSLGGRSVPLLTVTNFDYEYRVKEVQKAEVQKAAAAAQASAATPILAMHTAEAMRNGMMAPPPVTSASSSSRSGAGLIAADGSGAAGIGTVYGLRPGEFLYTTPPLPEEAARTAAMRAAAAVAFAERVVVHMEVVLTRTREFQRAAQEASSAAASNRSNPRIRSSATPPAAVITDPCFREGITGTTHPSITGGNPSTGGDDAFATGGGGAGGGGAGAGAAGGCGASGVSGGVEAGVARPPTPLTAEERKRVRPCVVISARVHPGETPASWIMQGILSFITSDHPTAVEIRRRAVVMIVPCLNPDGVIAGNQRCNLAGLDLNRQWGSPQLATAPTIYHLKRLLRGAGRWSPECPQQLFLFCDVHGHSRRQNFFLFGCSSLPRPKSRKSGSKSSRSSIRGGGNGKGGNSSASAAAAAAEPEPADDQSDGDIDAAADDGEDEENDDDDEEGNDGGHTGADDDGNEPPCTEVRPGSERMFPWLLQHHNPHFSYGGSSFDVTRGKMDSARVAVWMELGLPYCYTLESSFCGPSAPAAAPNGVPKGSNAAPMPPVDAPLTHFQIADFERAGQTFCKSLLDVLRPSGEVEYEQSMGDFTEEYPDQVPLTFHPVDQWQWGEGF
jgi:hypothetical protein